MPDISDKLLSSERKIKKLKNERKEVLKIFEQQRQHMERELRRIESDIAQK